MMLVPWDPHSGTVPEPVPVHVVEAAFATRGLIAPASYARFAAGHGGKRFASGGHRIRALQTGEPVGLGTIYHYDERQPRNLATAEWAYHADELDGRLVPIGATNFSGLLCLDCGGSGDPKVAIHDFEAHPGREVMLIAVDFEDLLARVGEL